MAKPKMTVLVKVFLNCINVWINDSERYVIEIKEIEGVDAVLFLSSNPISIYIDPRYDKEEVAEEIRTLLSSDVPEVFKENS